MESGILKSTNRNISYVDKLRGLIQKVGYSLHAFVYNVLRSTEQDLSNSISAWGHVELRPSSTIS